MSLKSQVYRSRSVTAGPYEVPPPPGSFHGDYAYDTYGSNFSSAPGFPEYGYPADSGWPAVEQGACGRGLAHLQVQQAPGRSAGRPSTPVAGSGEQGVTMMGTGGGLACSSLWRKDSCVTAHPS